MVNKSLIVILLIVSMIAVHCRGRNALTIEGRLPIDSLAELTLVNLLTAEQVFSDTVRPSNFRVQVPAIPQGIYLMEFKWNRYVFKPGEIKKSVQFNLSELPKYYWAKAIWIDHQRSQHIAVSTTMQKIEQEQVENLLFTEAGSVAMQASGSQENARIFENFLAIGQRNYLVNQEKRDSIKHLLYTANERGDYTRSKQLHAQTGADWIAGTKEQMQREEVAYLQEHIHSPIVPYILYARVATKEDYVRYKPVYDLLETPVKEKVAVWFRKYQE